MKAKKAHRISAGNTAALCGYAGDGISGICCRLKGIPKQQRESAIDEVIQMAKT